MFLLYGSYGYTGRLIAELAIEQGLRPVLAGRDAAALAAQAEELGLEHRVAPLDDPAALDAALAGLPAVLHCAGPFARTSRPMAEACLRAGVHYLDITGEVEVFEALAARDAEACSAGVMLLPGVGFDVVPTDCLAAHLKRRLPGAQRLSLAFRSSGGASRGTATTVVENQHRGGLVRRGGRLVHVPPGWRTRRIDFGRGPRSAVTIPWGDVSTAYHSTGIPDIEVYMALPPAMIRFLQATRYLAPLLALRPVKAVQKWAIRRRPPGPDAEARRRGSTIVWGEVQDDEGREAVSRLRGPEGYTFTAQTAVAAARKVLEGTSPPGFQTPSLAFGADFVLEIGGVEREDLR